MGAVLPPRPEHDPGGWCAIPIDTSASPRRAVDAHLDVLDPARTGESWSVLYAHSNCERLLARACEHRSIRHYLPLEEQWVGPDHARRRAIAPLFPSYLFVCMSPAERRDLLVVGHLARVIPVPQPDLLLAELRQVRDALAAGVDYAVGPALERGTWVRVMRGPMGGVVGRVEDLRRRKRRHRLVLNVSVLGRGVAIEIDALDVERVSTPWDAAASDIA